MPTSPPPRCNAPGCSAFASRNGRCDEHAPRAWRNVKRRKLSARFIRMRALVLREEPQCRYCGNESREVDHIVPLADGGAMCERENLQALCVPCHDRKTRFEASARARRRRFATARTPFEA